MDAIALSKSNFAEGFNCSQSVLVTFAEEFGLEPTTAARLASTFGGGIARSGRICGAVSGALMVIGLRYGNTLPTDRGAKEAAYALARRFMDEFSKRHGSVDCSVLLGCEIGTPEGMREARERDLFKTQCPVYVTDAVRILLTMKEEEISG
jgi:C_GCAxxG_C_C family probable redox protein